MRRARRTMRMMTRRMRMMRSRRMMRTGMRRSMRVRIWRKMRRLRMLLMTMRRRRMKEAEGGAKQLRLQSRGKDLARSSARAGWIPRTSTLVA
eukprot:275648-Pyramimonas_sp.AAC.1